MSDLSAKGYLHGQLSDYVTLGITTNMTTLGERTTIFLSFFESLLKLMEWGNLCQKCLLHCLSYINGQNWAFLNQSLVRIMETFLLFWNNYLKWTIWLFNFIILNCPNLSECYISKYTFTLLLKEVKYLSKIHTWKLYYCTHLSQFLKAYMNLFR